MIPVALIHHWLLLRWPSVAGPGVGVLGILIAIVAHRRAARAVAECTALINGSIGSRGTVDPRAYRDLAVVRYDALSEMSGQLSFSVALLNALGDGPGGAGARRSRSRGRAPPRRARPLTASTGAASGRSGQPVSRDEL